MATRTSVGSGNWGTAGTWDTGIPADGDDVVIASGHTVTFDVDQSAFTTGVKVTITGTLTHTTATGTYCLFAKTGASIVGAGTWNIGTSGTPIPFAAKHTITGAAGWSITGASGLTMTVYGAEPSIKYVKLSGDEAIGQTELSVDTDVTGDIWAAGDIVHICDINKAVELEERTIASGGIAAGTITVTAGLTAAKSAGAYIVLISRNVQIIAAGTNGSFITGFATSGKFVLGSGEIKGNAGKYGVYVTNGIMNGGVVHNMVDGWHLANGLTVNNGVITQCSGQAIYASYITINNGLFVGNANALLYCNYAVISGGTFSGNNYALNNCNYAVISGGTFSGNGTGVIGAYNSIVGGTFSNNTSGLNISSSIVTGGTFTGNTRDLSTCSNTNLYNVELTAAIEHNTYTSIEPTWLNCQSEHHDGVDGALKAWCKGGVVTSQTSVKPTGYTQAYLLDPESATYPVFFTKQFSVEPGKTVNVVVQLRKDASMTYLPRVYLMASIGNPLAGATPVDTFTMTDSTNTWETDTFTIVNSTNYDQDYTLYFVAQNASGNAYAAYDIATEGGTGGGGAVSIQPISGRLGL